MVRDEVFEYVVTVLGELDYSTKGVGFGTTLGPSGVDMESLELAELGVRVEDRFGVRFVADEAEELASMSIGEFADLVVARLELARSAGQP